MRQYSSHDPAYADRVEAVPLPTPGHDRWSKLMRKFTVVLGLMFGVYLPISGCGGGGSGSSGGAGTISTITRLAVVKAVQDKLGSLPGVDLAADAASMLQYVQGRPEFAAYRVANSNTGINGSSRASAGFLEAHRRMRSHG